VKLVEWNGVVDTGFSATAEFHRVQADILAGIAAVVWPEGANEFSINPTRNGNGVKPIKDAFITCLTSRGWVAEHDRFDAHLSFPGTAAPFAVEWETGNISSSHRAINRMALGMAEDRLSGGVLVLPTRNIYPYLTDRVGNYEELKPYFSLWGSQFREIGYLAIVGIEHDRTDPAVPLIRKGTDGRALL
jgi:hypothetical protein